GALPRGPAGRRLHLHQERRRLHHRLRQQLQRLSAARRRDDRRLGTSREKRGARWRSSPPIPISRRSEEHTSELQSLAYLVCRLPAFPSFPSTTLFRSRSSSPRTCRTATSSSSRTPAPTPPPTPATSTAFRCPTSRR